tara:strand:+ start:309 stop:449 length:141 start_codon:yes stop_codon:yes gene_type:complete
MIGIILDMQTSYTKFGHKRIFAKVMWNTSEIFGWTPVTSLENLNEG